MRKIQKYGICILLFIAPFFQVFAQHEWAPIGAKWYYTIREGWWPPNAGYLTIESVKDSVFMEKTVKVLRKTQFLSNGDELDRGSVLTYAQNDTIYYWTGSYFSILYDFSAIPGDRWLVYSNDFNPCGTDSTGIIEVDTVKDTTIYSAVLKCFYTSPDDTSIWSLGEVIEIMGSTGYMFPFEKGYCGLMDYTGIAGPLRCYEDSFLGIVKFNDMPCDTLINYHVLIKEIEDRISIFPIPFDDILTIDLGSYNRINLQISNSLGVLIFRNIIMSGRYELSLQGYPPDVYLLRLEDYNGDVIVKKILKY